MRKPVAGAVVLLLAALLLAGCRGAVDVVSGEPGPEIVVASPDLGDGSSIFTEKFDIEVELRGGLNKWQWACNGTVGPEGGGASFTVPGDAFAWRWRNCLTVWAWSAPDRSDQVVKDVCWWYEPSEPAVTVVAPAEGAVVCGPVVLITGGFRNLPQGAEPVYRVGDGEWQQLETDSHGGFQLGLHGLAEGAYKVEWGYETGGSLVKIGQTNFTVAGLGRSLRELPGAGN